MIPNLHLERAEGPIPVARAIKLVPQFLRFMLELSHAEVVLKQLRFWYFAGKHENAVVQCVVPLWFRVQRNK